jgi:hypothetical protein
VVHARPVRARDHWIGSFTSIQWKEDPANPDGGQNYPEKVLRESKRNIRVWLADGSNDQENPNYESWPHPNVELANALKLKSYDFRFSFEEGTHNPGQGASEFPDEMTGSGVITPPTRLNRL